MGIPGIYQEIGRGEREALVKLSIEHYEKTGRAFRLAIDTSIWSFQVQAAQGGTNPALRTLYYRLVRLMSVAVQPLFVFDGPHKPAIKRNKNSSRNVSIPDMMFKQLLKYFGFPYHVAPGEAEAECALLQREGIVDAVLSEDVDTLMFGCGLTINNWSSESTRGKIPTHVDVFDARSTKTKAGLDRTGIILIAMLSGGDYNTAGVNGFGIKLSCEAARANYGKRLCEVARDTAGLQAWRDDLNEELRENKKKFFRSKHPSVRIPDDFPELETLAYYTNPVVSNARGLSKLRDEISWDAEIDILLLRRFVADAFEWTGRAGAHKFIRGLAPALLIDKLRRRADRRSSGYNDLVLTAMNEMDLVRAICGKRTHFSTGGTPEMRVIIRPIDVVAIDLDAEELSSEDYGRDGLAVAGDDIEVAAYDSDDPAARDQSPSKRGRSTATYDPTQPEKIWVAETMLKVGIPLKVEDYEDSLRSPEKLLKQKAAGKRASKRPGRAQQVTGAGSMDRFVRVMKPPGAMQPAAVEELERALPETPPSSSQVLVQHHDKQNQEERSRDITMEQPLPRGSASQYLSGKSKKHRVLKNAQTPKFIPKDPWAAAQRASQIRQSAGYSQSFSGRNEPIDLTESPEVVISDQSSGNTKEAHLGDAHADDMATPELNGHQSSSSSSVQDLTIADLIHVTLRKHRHNKHRTHATPSQPGRQRANANITEVPSHEENANYNAPGSQQSATITAIDDNARLVPNCVRKLDFTATDDTHGSQLLTESDSRDELDIVDLCSSPHEGRHDRTRTTESTQTSPLREFNPCTGTDGMVLPDPESANQMNATHVYVQVEQKIALQEANRTGTDAHTGMEATTNTNNHTSTPHLPLSDSDHNRQRLDPHADTSENPLDKEHVSSSNDTVYSKAARKGYLMLRESLPGAWREASQEDVSAADHEDRDADRDNHQRIRRTGDGKVKARNTRMWRISQVEIVDLCEEQG